MIKFPCALESTYVPNVFPVISTGLLKKEKTGFVSSPSLFAGLNWQNTVLKIIFKILGNLYQHLWDRIFACTYLSLLIHAPIYLDRFIH